MYLESAELALRQFPTGTKIQRFLEVEICAWHVAGILPRDGAIVIGGEDVVCLQFDRLVERDQSVGEIALIDVRCALIEIGRAKGRDDGDGA